MKFYFSVSKVRKILLFLFIFVIYFSCLFTVSIHKVLRISWHRTPDNDYEIESFFKDFWDFDYSFRSRDFFTIFPDGLPPELPMVCGWALFYRYQIKVLHSKRKSLRLVYEMKIMFYHCWQTFGFDQTSKNHFRLLEGSLIHNKFTGKLAGFFQIGAFFGQNAKGVAHGNCHFLDNVDFRKSINLFLFI